MLFDIVFLIALLLSTFCCYRIIKSQKSKKGYIKAIRFFIFILCGSMILWPILLIACPMGNKLHEVIRLPRHIWMLQNAEIVKNIDYEEQFYGEHPRQYYLYFPAKPEVSKKNKVVFFIHGGGWCIGSPRQHRYLAKILTEQGYTLILPAYRFTPEFSHPDLQEDINNAFLSSKKHLELNGIQNPEFIIGGVSAGANLASLFAFDEQRWEEMGISRNQLKGVFSIAGALDLKYIEQTSTLFDYAGPAEGIQYKRANPVNYINKADHFPFLCIHGDKDGLTDLSNAQSFCNKLKKTIPEKVDFHTKKNTTHLDLGAGWYYDNNSNTGQDTILINWLNRTIKQ